LLDYCTRALARFFAAIGREPCDVDLSQLHSAMRENAASIARGDLSAVPLFAGLGPTDARAALTLCCEVSAAHAMVVMGTKTTRAERMPLLPGVAHVVAFQKRLELGSFEEAGE